MSYNVCASAGLPFQWRIHSHETVTLNEDKTLIHPVTAPGQKHCVTQHLPIFPFFMVAQLRSYA
jgi:hypothetical protein